MMHTGERSGRSLVGTLGPETPAKKRVSASDAWREARELLWGHRRRLLLGLALMLVGRLAGLVLPASSKWLIDEVIGRSRTDLLLPIALAAGAATVVQAITAFSLSQILGVAAQRAITEMRKRVQARIMRLPVAYFDSTQTGVLVSRIMIDAEGIRNLVGTGLVQLVGGLVTAVMGMGVLLWLNWRLTVVTLLVLGAFGSGMAYAFRTLRPLFRERGKINAEVTGRLTEAIGGIRVVKSYTAERREEIIFARGAHRLFRNVAKSMTGVSATTAGSTVVVGIIGVLMIWLGGRAIIAGEMTLGDLIMYVFFIGLVAAPLVSIASIGTQITEAFAGLDRIREILDVPTETDQDAARARVGSIGGEVTFEDVWFEYNPGQPVLHGISFRAAPGTTTALVGSSGSGKSTLISLVMAFNRPKNGRVLIDGRDLAGLKLVEYREQLASVLQDNFLFDGTIAANVGYARPGASLEEIMEACRIAHCDEFVARFPDGYQTIVGERGIKLSGGQRQRVSIARAILANPRILILDEATSSLDSESEQMIQDGLRQLRAGRTTFVIAHRLSTIRSADQILVLEAGQIVERGTHAELLALNGRYRQLHDKQYRFEADRFINPGEDFTPEPEKPVLPPPRVRTAL
ncbi:MAG: ABC transporter permease [Acidobacteria bacterium RIFCSPLOWO2_12_FULL_67_14]|nr:MAG: ABC transporter permease [Acidobacteria bacterium RIFCSPLOWO2_02_FULL_67_21]OFW35556.1 MAG: ABC transporter permease [Acidobacteria bacterium RIFCSPLOWO2_12_FULL_67_14]